MSVCREKYQIYKVKIINVIRFSNNCKFRRFVIFKSFKILYNFKKCNLAKIRCDDPHQEFSSDII